ncbi:hypothetical protein ACFE04_011203 [Oxalis oulophora]
MSLYAATKRAGEEIARAYNHIYGLSINGPWGMPDHSSSQSKNKDQIAIRCYQTPSDANNVVEGSFPRRDFLKCTGAAIGMELISSSGPFVETASAVDLIQQRQLFEFQRSRLLELEKDCVYVSVVYESDSSAIVTLQIEKRRNNVNIPD